MTGDLPHSCRGMVTRGDRPRPRTPLLYRPRSLRPRLGRKAIGALIWHLSPLESHRLQRLWRVSCLGCHPHRPSRENEVHLPPSPSVSGLLLGALIALQHQLKGAGYLRTTGRSRRCLDPTPPSLRLPLGLGPSRLSTCPLSSRVLPVLQASDGSLPPTRSPPLAFLARPTVPTSERAEVVPLRRRAHLRSEAANSSTPGPTPGGVARRGAEGGSAICQIQLECNSNIQIHEPRFHLPMYNQSSDLMSSLKCQFLV